MSLVLTVDGKFVDDLATNSGWREFTEWALKQEGYELRHLAYHGWTDRPDRLIKQLAKADPQKAGEDIASIATAMTAGLQRVGAVKDPEAVVVVSDGFGEGEAG